MLHKLNGIVIRTLDHGEGNKIVTLYTETLGKVSVMARGAKKVKSRHSAVTQLFTYGEYTFFKASGMGTLNSAEIVHAYHPIRENIMKTAYAAYIVELVDRIITEEDEGSTGLFNQLKGALDAIEADKDAAIVTHIFELKMLYVAGYAPVLDRCVSCGQVDRPFRGFDLSSGGLVCLSCAAEEGRSIVKASERTMKLARLLQQTNLNRLGQITVSAQTKSELLRFMRALIDEYVPSKWKARNFLDQMEKYGFDES